MEDGLPGTWHPNNVYQCLLQYSDQLQKVALTFLNGFLASFRFLYLYELEYCNFNNGPRPVDKEPRFKVGQYVRIESSVLEGQIFYAQISKYRWRNNTNMYYVHYNGWSTSHDEWMPEDVLDNLKPSEAVSPADLVNPNPSRSSKSNHIIVGDSATAEKHQHLHYMMKQPVRINHSANPMSSPTVLRPVLSPAGRSANATYQPIHRQQSVSPNWEFIRHELMQVEDEISKRKHHNFTTLDPDDSDEDCPSLNEKDKESLQTRKRPLGQFNLHLAGLEMPVGYNPDLFRKLLEKVNNNKRKTKDIDATTLEKPITATTTTRTTRKTTNATPSKEPSPILTAKSNVDTAFLDDRSLEQIAASISQIESQMAQIEEQLRIRAGGKIEEMDEHQQLSTSNESSAQTSSGSSDTEEPAPKAQTITRRKRIT